MNPGLSVVVVTYNAQEPLARTIESIKLQGHSELLDTEFILVDGGSSDATVLVAQRSEIFNIVISEPDDGIYDAMNKGSRLATRTWIQYLNAGDTYNGSSSLSTLNKTIALAESSLKKWVVLGAVHGNGRRIRNVPHNWIHHALGIQPHCHQATLIRADYLFKLGGFSTQFGTAGDFDLIMRAGINHAPLEEPDLVIRYEGGGVSATNPFETAFLLGSVRKVRFKKVGVRAQADNLLSLLAGIYNYSRIAAGRARMRLRSWRRRPVKN